jgi:hypothetical protein
MRSTRLYTTQKPYKAIVGFVFCIALTLPTLLFAQIVTVPNTFRNGDVADATKVNANFTTLQDAVNKNANRSDDNLGNTAGGSGALQNKTTGGHTTAFGASALFSNTTGSDNTAVGFDALQKNTTGGMNTAVGSDALVANITGNDNTAIGFDALVANTTGNDNTAVGFDALQKNTTGGMNTAVGSDALVANTTGNDNTAIGFDALVANTTGNSNIAVGFNALVANTTGNSNIAVGVGAGGSLTSGSNNIYLGSSSATATELNTMRLGGMQQTQTFIAGITGVPVTGSAVLISSTGQLGISASSIRYKRDIQPMGAHSRGLLQLRPVTFRYKQDAQGERQYGLIAEEVAKVYPELVTRGATGEVETVRYHEMMPMLLNEMQQQQRQLGTQTQQLTLQARQLAELQAQNARLRAALEQQQIQNTALETRLDRLEATTAHAGTLASR